MNWAQTTQDSPDRRRYSLRQHSSLPEGYRLEKTVSLLLFDPNGALLQDLPDGPSAAALADERAWEHAWRQVESELREETRAFREGTRPIEDLRRFRQYVRMLDAVERSPAELQEQAARTHVARRRAVGGIALVAAAAALAVFVTRGPVGLDVAQNGVAARPTTAVEDVAAPRPKPALAERRAPRPAAPKAPAVAKAATATVVAGRISTPAPRVTAGGKAAPTRRTVAPRAGVRTPLSGYAVSFGEFATHATAEARMRLIRAKGYLVYVAQVGDAYLVVTRPYPTRQQADRLANALQDIGLPATTQIAGTFLL